MGTNWGMPLGLLAELPGSLPRAHHSVIQGHWDVSPYVRKPGTAMPVCIFAPLMDHLV